MARRGGLTQAQKDKALAMLKLLAEEQDPPAITPGPDQSPPPDGCAGCCDGDLSERAFTDEELIQLLAMFCWDPRTAAYHVLLRKARNTQTRIPGGLELPDQSERYLRLAAALRRNGGRAMARADGT